MFNEADLDFLREAQTDHMQDTCSILSFSAGTANEFGEYDTATYATTITTRCGLDMNPQFGANFLEGAGEQYTKIVYDAMLRLPREVELKETDRIQVTHRFGEALDTALTYEVVSPILRGPSGIRVRLKKVVV